MGEKRMGNMIKDSVESIINGLNQYNKEYNLKQSIIFLYLKWPPRLLYLQRVSTYFVFPLTY